MSVCASVPKFGGQVCPICGTVEWTLYKLQKVENLTPEDTFNCPVCDCKLRYTYRYRFPHNHLYLHVVSDVLTADGSIKL
jgi:hypothetical protein